MSLRYYYKEHQAYPEAYKLILDDDQAEVIAKKLCLHFMKKRNSCVGIRVRHPNIIFYGNRQSGMAYTNGNIRLSHNPSLGLICHEVAHQVHRYNYTDAYGKRHHTKRLMRTIGKLVAYAMKKALWITVYCGEEA